MPTADTDKPEGWSPPELTTDDLNTYSAKGKKEETWDEFRLRMPQSLIRELTTLANKQEVQAIGHKTAADLVRTGTIAMVRAIAKALSIDDPALVHPVERERLRARMAFLNAEGQKLTETLTELNGFLGVLFEHDDWHAIEATLAEYVDWSARLDPLWQRRYLEELAEVPAVRIAVRGLRLCGREVPWLNALRITDEDDGDDEKCRLTEDDG